MDDGKKKIRDSIEDISNKSNIIENVPLEESYVNDFPDDTSQEGNTDDIFVGNEETGSPYLSEDLYKLIIQNTNDLICITTFDFATKYLYISPSYKRILGYDPEEMIGLQSWKFTHPDDKKNLLPILTKYLGMKVRNIFPWKKKVITEYFEFRIMDKMGKWHYMESTANIIGKNLLFVSKDVTERKKSDEIIRESERRYRTYVDSAPDGIFIWDRDGNIIDVNDAATRITGFSKKELLCKSVEDTIPEEGKEEILDHFQRLLSEGESYVELPFIHRDGSVRWWQVKSVRLSDNRFLNFTYDITEKKVVVEKLQRIFDMSSELICEADINTATFTKVNPAFTRVLGYSEDELLAHSFLEFIHPDDKEPTQKVIDEQLQRGETVLTFINRYRCKDGSYVWLDWNSHPVPDKGFTYAIARDITENKRAKETIIQEKETAEEYLQLAGTMILSLDKNGFITLLNKKGYEILGYEEGELLGKNWFDNCLPDYQVNEVKGVFEKIMNGEIASFEQYNAKIKRKNGEERLISWHNTDITDKEGSITGTLSSGEDITEQEHAHQKLMQSQKETELILNTAGDGIRIVTKDFKIKMMNDTFAELIGFSKEEAIGQYCYDVFHSKDCNTEDCPMRRVLKTGESFEIETIRTTLDNREINCILKVSPFKNEKDEIIGIIEDFRDITKLKQSQARFRNIFENKGTATGIFRDDSIIIQCNSKFVEQSGYSRDEIIGKMHWYDFVHKGDIDEMMRFHQQRSAGGNPPGLYECRMVTKNGEIRTMVVNIGVIPDSKERIVSLVDITNQKNVETNLRNTQEELKRLNNNLEREVEDRTQKIKKLLVQKDEFINQLGHDLKNPLGPLVNLLPILEKNETDPKQKEMIQVMNRNVAYIRNLVTKTIQLAQLKSPSSGLNYETIDLGQQVDEILRNNQFHLEEKYIVADNRIPAGVMVDADRLKLQEVFNNLLNNAVKYNKEDGGNIIIDQTLNGDTIMVSVKDFGVGMTEEQLGKVFDEFYKADTSRHDFESSGLGMAITKRIVEKHGGKIWAESEGIGKGSTFYFTLPIRNNDKH